MPGEFQARILTNPFLVLGLTPSCTRRDVEREGQKLLGMLELGLADAQSYSTPLGPLPRTPELVRESMAELRDPGRRLSHELLFCPEAGGTDPAGEGSSVRWEDAFSALGWGPWLSR